LVNSINLAITFTAGENSVTVRDVGRDVLRVEPDGTVVLLLIGQLPFAFTGVMMLDPDTGEVILEPQHSLEGDVEAVCAALTA
jgi:hypothetical protein